MIPSRHAAVAVALLLGLSTLVGSARGEDRKKITGHEMEVVVDWRWPGCHFGGYFPVRVQMRNDGPAREVTLRFEPAPDQDAPVVDQVVKLGRDATVRTTLSVPVVGQGTSGNVLVLQNGVELATLTWGINLPDPEYGAARPALLLVNDGVVDASNFEIAVDNTVTRGSSSFTADHVVLPPEDLPDRWIDFTGVDVIAIPLPLLREGRLGPKRREALIRWIESGGTLIVDQLGGHPSEAPGLDAAIGFEESGFADDQWWNMLPVLLDWDRTAALTTRNQPTTDDWDQTAALLVALQSGRDVPTTVASFLGDDPDPALVRRATEIANQRPFWWQAHSTQWPSRGIVPFTRELGYGRVVAFTGDPFTGQADDWAKLINSLANAKSLAGSSILAPVWPQRYGISPRSGDDDFQLFLIPGVRNVPVVSFLVLISIFAIVIGPLNYFVLARRRQLNMLIVTIPVLALLTSLALFGYSTVSQGFSIRSRTRSVTLLDQRSGRELTTARVAMFAGMAPSGGLEYEPTTAVHTIWPDRHEFRGAHVTWTGDKQLFDSGWLRPRTRTQFLLMKNAPNPKRIEVASETNGRIRVTNQLGGEVEFLAFRGSDGRWYAGKEIDSGAAAELLPFTEEDTDLYRELLRRHPLSAPEASAFGGDMERDPEPWNEWDEWNHDPRFAAVDSRYTANSAERLLARVSTAVGDDKPTRFDYVAVLRESPDVDMGLDNTWPEVGVHVVVGFR